MATAKVRDWCGSTTCDAAWSLPSSAFSLRPRTPRAWLKQAILDLLARHTAQTLERLGDCSDSHRG
jgi:hypothetical protein